MNIIHIKNLIVEYLITNVRRDSVNILLCVTGLAFCFSIIGQPEINVLLIEIMALLAASRMFWKLGNPSASIQYLTVPAGTAEKWLAGILLVNVYVVLLSVFAAWFGYTLAYLVEPLKEGNASLHQVAYGDWMLRLVDTQIVTLFVWISVFFFGSVFFRKHAFVKTIVTIAVAGFILVVLIAFVSRMNLCSVGACYISEISSTYITYIWTDGIVGHRWHRLPELVVMVYFYGLSFLRLRETDA